MDTNVTSLPPEPHLDAAAHPRAGLPGEAALQVQPHLEGEALDGPGAPAAPRSRRRDRSLLLASVALLSVVAIGGAFLVSPYNTILPVNTARLGAQARQLAASAGVTNPPVVAPAAKLATAPRREVKPALREEVRSATAGEQTSEILSLRQGTTPQATDAVPGEGQTDGTRLQRPGRPTPISNRGSVEAGSAPGNSPPASGAAQPIQSQATSNAAARVALTALIPGMAALAPSVPEAAPALEVGLVPQTTFAPPASALANPLAQGSAEPASSASVPADRVSSTPAATRPAQATGEPGDAVTASIALRPGSLARGEQTDVLHVVAQLAIIMRDLRAQNVTLRSSVQASTEKIDSAVADFERRLALAEARGALSAAMGADPATASTTTVPAPRTAHLSGNATTQSAGAPTQAGAGAGSTAGPRRYKVQAASPGLAMLSELDRSGGEGSQLQIGVGDQVPGYGKVTAIQQRGSTWLVQTDRGAIQ